MQLFLRPSLFRATFQFLFLQLPLSLISLPLSSFPCLFCPLVISLPALSRFLALISTPELSSVVSNNLFLTCLIYHSTPCMLPNCSSLKALISSSSPPPPFTLLFSSSIPLVCVTDPPSFFILFLPPTLISSHIYVWSFSLSLPASPYSIRPVLLSSFQTSVCVHSAMLTCSRCLLFHCNVFCCFLCFASHLSWLSLPAGLFCAKTGWGAGTVRQDLTLSFSLLLWEAMEFKKHFIDRSFEALFMWKGNNSPLFPSLVCVCSREEDQFVSH